MWIISGSVSSSYFISSSSSVQPWVGGLLQVLSHVAAELLMLVVSIQFSCSTSTYYCGLHLSLRSLSRKFLSFFWDGSGCSTLWLPFLDMVHTLEIYVEKSFLMVRDSFSLLYLFSGAARATRHCFAVSRAVVTGVSLSFLSQSWFLVAFPSAISLGLLTFDLNRLIFLSRRCC